MAIVTVLLCIVVALNQCGPLWPHHQHVFTPYHFTSPLMEPKDGDVDLSISWLCVQDLDTEQHTLTVTFLLDIQGPLRMVWFGFGDPWPFSWYSQSVRKRSDSDIINHPKANMLSCNTFFKKRLALYVGGDLMGSSWWVKNAEVVTLEIKTDS